MVEVGTSMHPPIIDVGTPEWIGIIAAGGKGAKY
jgi:hypothetical protein